LTQAEIGAEIFEYFIRFLHLFMGKAGEWTHPG